MTHSSAIKLPTTRQHPNRRHRMCRFGLLTICAALLTACGEAEVSDTTTPATVTTTAVAATITTSVPTTTNPVTTAPSPATTLPETPVIPEVEALAWGLLCRDLATAGWGYFEAIAYWEIEGRPARMDADENGIPCETVFPASDITAYWGDPLPTGLEPGPGSGWRPSDKEAPVAAACCSMNHNGPTSPPLPAESGPFVYDGPYSVTVTRQEGETDILEMEIRRWLACSEQPDRCSPDLFPGDVYTDPDNSVTRTVALDDELLVVILPIACIPDDTWIEAPIEGSGAAFATLLHRIDAAVTTVIAPMYGTNALENAGAEDPTFPYGPVPCEELGWVTGYRGPEDSFLTDGWYTVFTSEEPTWMYGWWNSLEIRNGNPILYIWAGQIAG